MPHILDKISAHKRALASILHTGLAKSHKAKPSSALHLEKIYGSSVLFSGIASLVLNERELRTLSSHFKLTLCRLQKLPLNTPDCVVFFLSGNLPAAAIVHLKMLTLLGMISRLKSTSILQQIGRNILLMATPIKKSWFSKIRDITYQYSLPDPLLILQEPKSKESWKKQCKSAVVSFWEVKLRSEAEFLPSLVHFQPNFMSLVRPHIMWTLPENGYEVEKAVVIATMLSGRYMSDYHTRHWSKSNPLGYCQLCQANLHSQPSLGAVSSDVLPLGTLEHQLLVCPSLETSRERCKTLWKESCLDKPDIWNLIDKNDSMEPHPQLQFLLDPSCCPGVILATQKLGQGVLSHVHYLSRTWCYSLHVRRKKLLKLFNIL